MAERAASQAEMYDEGKSPRADAERPSQRTIDESGWWRAHFLVLTSVFIGMVALLISYGAVWYWLSHDSALYQISVKFSRYLLLGVFLLFTGSYFATLYGYYIEAKILKQSDANWQPNWWLYVIATPFVTAVPVSLIYLFNRWRHVGIQWEQLAIWR